MSEGCFGIASNDAPKVVALVELALNKGEIYENEILLGDVIYKQYFLEEMQKANINYSTEKRQYGEWIVWDKNENGKVGKAIKTAWEKRVADFIK